MLSYCILGCTPRWVTLPHVDLGHLLLMSTVLRSDLPFGRKLASCTCLPMLLQNNISESSSTNRVVILLRLWTT